jgi:hypothetical protein
MSEVRGTAASVDASSRASSTRRMNPDGRSPPSGVALPSNSVFASNCSCTERQTRTAHGRLSQCKTTRGNLATCLVSSQCNPSRAKRRCATLHVTISSIGVSEPHTLCLYVACIPDWGHRFDKRIVDGHVVHGVYMVCIRVTCSVGRVCFLYKNDISMI